MSAPTVTVSYRLLDPSKEYPIKSPCPYCGGKLRISINGAELADDGTWFATDLQIDCDSEPNIDGPFHRWDNWWADHSNDFCEAWHTLHDRLVRNLKKFCRVDYPRELGDK